MTTQLQIGQMALAEIGTRSTVTSSGTTPNGTVFNDGSEEALYLDMYYYNVRQQALSAAYWNFAKVTDTIQLYKALPGTPENPTTPPGITGWSQKFPQPPWLYSYLYPTDAVVTRSIVAQPDISIISPPLYPIMGTTISFPRALHAPFATQIDLYDTNGVRLTTPVKVILTNAQSPILEYTAAPDESLWQPDFIMTMVKALAGYVALALTSDKALAQMKLQEANGIIMEARRVDANEGTTVLEWVPDWLRIRGVGGNFWNDFDFYYPYGPLFSLSGYL